MPNQEEAHPPKHDTLPAAFGAKFEQALALHRRGQVKEAERLYEEVLQQQPNHFGALYRLGTIAIQTRRAERGVELIASAIKLDANVAVAHYALGSAFLALKRHEDALASYDKAIALSVDFAAAYYSRGNLLLDLKRPDDALASFDKAIALSPDFAAAHYSRGNTIDMKRPEAALASYDKAIGLRANFAAAYYNRGNTLLDLRRFEAALASYDKAIALEPGFAFAYNNRGSALLALKRLGDALGSYDKAIALKPDFAAAHGNRGQALRDLKRPEDALASYDRAVALKPDHPEGYSNRGLVLQDLQRPEDALLEYDRAIALKPDDAETNWRQSLCRLQMGRFEQGWRQYEWRKKRNIPVAARSFPQPVWLGDEDIRGKALFIWWEQGFGDTIQFCRYAKLAEAWGAKVIMSVQQSLRGLMAQISPTIEVMNSDGIPRNFDFHSPLLSLPLAFRTTLQTIPTERQYLKSDGALRVAWSARLPPKTKSRIGVVWSGRPTHNNDHYRSIELEQICRLFRLDAHWISLQKDVSEEHLALLQQNGCFAFDGEDLTDFSDTAALVDLMDLVITVDTSVAHLARAMGKAVWILLPSNPDWRWLLGRDDSPWYPSARLFRQQQIGNWSGVLDRVKDELRSVIS